MLKRTTTARKSGFSEPLRPLPHSIDAEQAILGAILTNAAALDRVSGIIEAGDFCDALHQKIFTIIAELASQQQTIAPTTVSAYLTEDATPKVGSKDRAKEKLTALQYMGRLAGSATTVIDVAGYARLVKDLSLRRAIIAVADEARELAYLSPVDASPRSQIESFEARLFNLLDGGQQVSKEFMFADALGAAVINIQAAHRGEIIPGLETSFIDLDRILGGMQGGDLILLAARPSMGKTALAANIARAIALKGKAVAFYTQEMSAEQVALRVLGEQAGYAPTRLRLGAIQPGEWVQTKETAEKIVGLPIILDETGGLSMAQLAMRSRRLKRKHNIQLIVVDYLQLMNSGHRTENRNLEITAITGGM